MDKHWYVLYVCGNKEQSIVSFLRNEGLLSFTPLMEKLHKKQGVFHKVIVPMFPNYVFVSTELDQKEFHEKLRSLRERKQGIVKQLSYDNEGTSALREEEQAFLSSLMDEEYLVKHSVGMIEGDRVVIMEGPLIGFESKIVKINRHNRMAYLDQELLGRPIKISLEIIKKI